MDSRSHVMKFSILSLAILIAISSVHASNISLMHGKITSQLTDCYCEWKSLVEEWKNFGGHFNGSLLEVREHIKSDDQSALSQLIRYSWQQLKAQDQIEFLVTFGHWPISEKKLRATAFIFDFKYSGNLSKECQYLSWLNLVIWDELRTNSNEDKKIHRFK